MTGRAMLSAVALGAALVTGSETVLAQPGPPVAPPAPPRDARSSAAGTATIRGRITAADTTRPLRRAQIRLTGADLGPQGRTTSSDPDGRYELKDVPPG